MSKSEIRPDSQRDAPLEFGESERSTNDRMTNTFKIDCHGFPIFADLCAASRTDSSPRTVSRMTEGNRDMILGNRGKFNC